MQCIHWRIAFNEPACAPGQLVAGWLMSRDAVEVTCHDCIEKLAGSTERAVLADVVHMTDPGWPHPACGAGPGVTLSSLTNDASEVTCPRCRLVPRLVR